MSSLLEKTQALLKERPRTLTFIEIKKQTGLTAAWLSDLSQGKTTPSVDKVQKLYEFLSNKKLDV